MLFFESAILNFFFWFWFFFFFIPMKTSQSLLVSKDGSKFWSSQSRQHFLTQIKLFAPECTLFALLLPTHLQKNNSWQQRGMCVNSTVQRPFFLGCKRGGSEFGRVWKFFHSMQFFCTACSFYCTADARSDSENLQKFLKKWLFWTYFVPIISKPI